MTWTALLLDQIDFYWTTHFRPRLEGLTDDEYLWEPATGAWSLRPDADGEWVLDGTPWEPPVAPVTTIAWRIVHMGRDCIGKRARAFFAPGDVEEEVVMYDDAYWPEPPPTNAADALTFLDEAYAIWRGGISSLNDEDALRPLGPRGGPYADDSLAALILHISREVMAHGAEICLLRDLYRAQIDADDPLAAAVARDEAADVIWLLAGGADGRPTLTAEAAGLGHWAVVVALAEGGADVNASNPGALHYAAAAGEERVVDMLLKQGADATVLDPQWNLPPSGWADFFGHAGLAEKLKNASGQGSGSGPQQDQPNRP